MVIKKIALIGLISIMMSTSSLGCTKHDEQKKVESTNKTKTSEVKENNDKANISEEKENNDKANISEEKEIDKVANEKKQDEQADRETVNKSEQKKESKKEVSSKTKENKPYEKKEEASVNNESTENNKNQQIASKKIILSYYNAREDYSETQLIETDSVSPESIINVLRLKGMIESDIIDFKIQESKGVKIGILNVPKNSTFIGSSAYIQRLDHIADTFKNTLGLDKFKLLEDGNKAEDGHINGYER